MGMNDYSHMYSTRFKNALEVAEYLDLRRGPLLGRILAWQAVVYGEGRLPGWLQDSLVNVFAVLAQQSFWSRSLDLGHWWGEEGLFCVNESILSCPQQSCIANDEFGEWPVDLFFPELAANKLRAFRHYQRPSGQTPSTLGTGTELDQPWYDHSSSPSMARPTFTWWTAFGKRRVTGPCWNSSTSQSKPASSS